MSKRRTCTGFVDLPSPSKSYCLIKTTRCLRRREGSDRTTYLSVEGDLDNPSLGLSFYFRPRLSETQHHTGLRTLWYEDSSSTICSSRELSLVFQGRGTGITGQVQRRRNLAQSRVEIETDSAWRKFSRILLSPQ